MLLKLLIFLTFVSAVPRVAPAQEPVTEKTLLQPIGDEIDNDVSIDSPVINEHLFIKFFVKRRKEHSDIVGNIRRMTNYEKRYKMVSILAENSLNIIEKSRRMIENMKFVPGDGEALKNITIRHALAALLENCALFGDVILQLPDITRRMMKSQKSWSETLQLGLKFVNETQHLLDESTVSMFALVHQELKITPRHRNYTNPYRSKENEGIKSERDGGKRKKVSAKESKRNKGPRMINIEL